MDEYVMRERQKLLARLYIYRTASECSANVAIRPQLIMHRAASKQFTQV